MAAARLDQGLLFEIAPPILASGRPTVLACLRKLIQNPDPKLWSPKLKDALRLAALTYQIVERVVSDSGVVSGSTSARSNKQKLERGWLSVPASTLVWTGSAAKNVRPLRRTQKFLDDLPDVVVDRLLGWTTPVVIPNAKNGENWVVAGHVPAVIARQRRPDAAVRVRWLRATIPRKRSFFDVCADTLEVLAPLYVLHRRFIAEISIDDWEAQFLTGYSRAHFFRLKGWRDA